MQDRIHIDMSHIQYLICHVWFITSQNAEFRWNRIAKKWDQKRRRWGGGVRFPWVGCVLGGSVWQA